MTDLDEATDRQLKVVLLGDGTTGKTSIATRLSRNSFETAYQQTVGLDFFLKRLVLPENTLVTLKVWDLGGQTIGGPMLDNYVYGAHAVLFVYDITNYSSFENLEEWLKVVKRVCVKGGETPNPHLALVANKMDLEHRCTVRRDRHNQFAKQFRMSSHFISAKTDDLVDQCFTRIAAEVMGVRLSTLDLEKTAKVVKADIPYDHRSSSAGATQKTRRTSSFCSIQ